MCFEYKITSLYATCQCSRDGRFGGPKSHYLHPVGNNREISLKQNRPPTVLLEGESRWTGVGRLDKQGAKAPKAYDKYSDKHFGISAVLFGVSCVSVSLYADVQGKTMYLEHFVSSKKERG